MFITFEGVEGAGKTTQFNRLASLIKEAGTDLVITREPGGTQFGEAVRDILLDKRFTGMEALSECFLYAASRRQHVKEVIEPALKTNKYVLCDRYADATTAYQAGGRGLDIKMVETITEWATDGLQPDLTFIFDCSPEVGLSRAKNRSEADRIESESIEFHNKIRNAYLNIAKNHPERVVVINGEDDIEKVWDEVLNTAKQRIKCLKG